MNIIKQWLTKEIVIGVIRHLLTFGGAILLKHGIDQHTNIMTLSDAVSDPKVWGAITALAGVTLSMFHKQDVAATIAAVQTTTTVTTDVNGTPVVVRTSPSGVLPSPHNLPAIALACLLAFSFTAKAQDTALGTNASPATASALNKTNLVPVISAAANWFASVKPYLSNSVAIVEGGPVYSVHTKAFGGWGAVRVPVNDLLSLGFDGIAINNNIYFGPFSASIGREFKGLPVIGSVYTYAESGPTLQFGHGSTLGAQSFAGFQKKWDISPKFELMIGGGTGNITGESGLIVSGQIALSYHWGK